GETPSSTSTSTVSDDATDSETTSSRGASTREGYRSDLRNRFQDPDEPVDTHGHVREVDHCSRPRDRFGVDRGAGGGSRSSVRFLSRRTAFRRAHQRGTGPDWGPADGRAAGTVREGAPSRREDGRRRPDLP